MAVSQADVRLTLDKTAAVEALIKPLRTPFSDDAHILHLAHATRTYKTLLSGGHYNTKTSEVDVVDAILRSSFAKAIFEAVISDEAGGEQNLKDMAVGDVALVLVELISGLSEESKRKIKEILTGVDIAGSNAKGAALLAERVAEL
jgi:pumilio homology domain family member 6